MYANLVPTHFFLIWISPGTLFLTFDTEMTFFRKNNFHSPNQFWLRHIHIGNAMVNERNFKKYENLIKLLETFSNFSSLTRIFHIERSFLATSTPT